MAEVVERLDGVERRLTSVENGLSELRTEVGGLGRKVDGLGSEVGSLRGEVGTLRGEVGTLRGEVGSLRGEVQKLRILGEENTTDIKQIAEVQVQHGNRLDEITKALEPLARLDVFVRLVAGEHEKRITDLERHTGIRE